MKLHGVEIEFDLFDAEITEKYEAAAMQFQQDSSKPVDERLLSHAIRSQCEMLFHFFDHIFVEGFHKQLFGERTNLSVCLDAFEEFTQHVKEQRAAMDARLKRYSPERSISTYEPTP